MKTKLDKNSHELQEFRRLSAVELRKNGVAPEAIARSYGVTTQTACNWTSRAKRFGKSSLKSTKTTGAPPALRETDFRDLTSCLRRPASELGYATDLWSGPRVRHLIKHRYGVAYHPCHMPRFLRRLGLVQKFPERRALEQDLEEVRRWKEERLPEILAEAKNRRALLFYADEAVVSLIPNLGKTWTFPEMKPLARVSGRRGQNTGVTGAVNPRGRFYFEMTREDERFTSSVFLRFLENLRREYPKRRITLIVDGASVHTAKKVKDFLQENTWLRLEYLPSYSPEWNPAEKPWGYLKGKARNGSQSRNVKELRSETRRMLNRLKKKSKYVKSFFTPPT